MRNAHIKGEVYVLTLFFSIIKCKYKENALTNEPWASWPKWLFDPDLCRNTTKYTNNHKNKDAVEITLHSINIKELKLVYKQDGNKLGRVLVAYL